MVVKMSRSMRQTRTFRQATSLVARMATTETTLQEPQHTTMSSSLLLTRTGEQMVAVCSSSSNRELTQRSMYRICLKTVTSAS